MSDDDGYSSSEAGDREYTYYEGEDGVEGYDDEPLSAEEERVLLAGCSLDELREMAFKYVARNFRRIRAEARATLLALQDNPTLMMEVMLDAL